MRSSLSGANLPVDDPVERAIEAYRGVCASSDPSLERFWESLGRARSLPILSALVKFDLLRRFETGERPKVAEYLQRFPILAESGDGVVSLVYEEFCLLEESGEKPDSLEFCAAYGRWRDSLLSQLAYHRELSRAVGSDLPSVRFPSPGDRFGRYQLRSILGTGGVARVYLATEDDLGGRKLAIKVSASYGQEPSILGKLDHGNIVPILTVAESDEGLRGICMPYRPGMTLEDLIVRIGRGSPPPAARAIWEAMEPREPTAEVAREDPRPGWAGFPIKQTFPEAIAWIGLALTNALSYLHGQGVYHRDIKPANVLLAYREGPQLLDFNLAQDPKAPEHVNAALKGGTLPYMAPEQLKAFLDPSGWSKVGPAADLYSLGLVLKELVTGQRPEVPTSRSSIPRGVQSLLDRRVAAQTPIREINPSVPPALASIIEKCLATDPSDRHATASDLAADLRRFLDRRPLEHAPNTSKVERAVNWFFRNRSILASVTTLLLVSAVLNLLRSPAPIAETNDFHRGERLLDSDRPEDWGRARIVFEGLHHDHPASAWPSLYLGLTLQRIGVETLRRASLEAVGSSARADLTRLGKNSLTTASDLTLVALKCADAEEAITGRLKKVKVPNSAGLLTDLGVLLNKNNHLERARAVLSRAHGIDPNAIPTLGVLVDVERKSRRYEDAVRYVSRLIPLMEKDSRIHAQKVHEMRKVWLDLLKRLADRDIDDQESARGRARAVQHLDSMKANVEAFRGDWRNMAGQGSEEIHRYNERFYEGCIASCEGVLAADNSNFERAGQRFDDARLRFDQAFETLPPRLRDEGVRLDLEDQGAKLERRRDKFDARRKTTAAASVPGD